MIRRAWIYERVHTHTIVSGVTRIFILFIYFSLVPFKTENPTDISRTLIATSTRAYGVGKDACAHRARPVYT